MSLLANTPKPPYYTVIFTSVRTDIEEGYEATALKMLELAAQQPGFLGVESAREAVGISVSYWSDVAAIKEWKQQLDHLQAQAKGRQLWYTHYRVRVAKVERDYGM